MTSKTKRSWRRRIGSVTVYQRGGKLWIYYRQGQPIRRAVGTDRDAALTLAAKINAQLAEGAPTSLTFRPISIEQLITAWLEHLEHVRRLAIATVSRYRTSIEHLKRFISSVHPGLRADRFLQHYRTTG